MSLVAGVSLDGVIARFLGVQGYGAIVGAGLGNCVADVIAGLPDGLYSSLGVGVGTLLPLTPLIIPMVLKRPFTSTVSHAFGASSLGFCVLAFVWGWRHHHQDAEGKYYVCVPWFMYCLDMDVYMHPERSLVLIISFFLSELWYLSSSGRCRQSHQRSQVRRCHLSNRATEKEFS